MKNHLLLLQTQTGNERAVQESVKEPQRQKGFCGFVAF